MFIKTKDGGLQMSVIQSTFVKRLVYFAFRKVFIANIRLKLCNFFISIEDLSVVVFLLNYVLSKCNVKKSFKIKRLCYSIVIN